MKILLSICSLLFMCSILFCIVVVYCNCMHVKGNKLVSFKSSCRRLLLSLAVRLIDLLFINCSVYCVFTVSKLTIWLINHRLSPGPVSSIYRVFQKSSPLKLFGISTSVKSFCMTFCKFVGNSYPHISANFCTFILIFHQMALIFLWVPIVFTVSRFEYSLIKWNYSVPAFQKWRHFFVIACQCPIIVKNW